jgi:hypothetical protein
MSLPSYLSLLRLLLAPVGQDVRRRLSQRQVGGQSCGESHAHVAADFEFAGHEALGSVPPVESRVTKFPNLDF